jgi:hypothetical protein
MNSERKTYRLDTAVRPAERQSDECNHDTRNPGPGEHYLSDPFPLHTCKLPKGHEGRHDPDANWNTYVKVEAELSTVPRDWWHVTVEFMTYGGHGWHPGTFHTRDEMQALIDFLGTIQDEVWPLPKFVEGEDYTLRGGSQ